MVSHLHRIIHDASIVLLIALAALRKKIATMCIASIREFYSSKVL